MAVLLVDATNAFNFLNRHVALQKNVFHFCLSIAPAIVNTYRADAQLFVDRQVIYSREGTTKGDPLPIAMYTIAAIPHIHKLDKLSQVSKSGLLTMPLWVANSISLNIGGQNGGDWTRLQLSCYCHEVMAHCQGGTYSPDS